MNTSADLFPFLLETLRCAICGSERLNWSSSHRARQQFSSPGRLVCLDCGFVGRCHSGYLDLMREEEKKQKLTGFQFLMQFPPAVAIYDTLWRPIGYFIASDNSFQEDVARILNLMDTRGRKIYLDLACGPGQFARQIARMAPEAIVIGCDISHPMLEKAVRLTRREGLQNVFYVRGSAIGMPFKSEVFDALVCCGALQSIMQRERALREIARVLKVKGDFVCQTTLGPRKPPLYVRAADELLKFSYFHLDELHADLRSLQFDVIEEERHKINYIFRAEKARRLTMETA